MTVEPRIEDLLATIRKAIDTDLGDLDRRAQARPISPPPSYQPQIHVPQMPVPQRGAVDATKDIDALRERVNRQRFEQQVPVPQYAPPPQNHAPSGQRNHSMGHILGAQPAPSLRPSFADEDTQYAPAPVYHEQHYYQQQPRQQEPAYYPPEQQQPLMTQPAAYAAQASFAALSQQITEQFPDDGRIEEIAREMLRPMLQNWLDDNLPPLVETLVREEISRVARRGR